MSFRSRAASAGATRDERRQMAELQLEARGIEDQVVLSAMCAGEVLVGASSPATPSAAGGARRHLTYGRV